MPNLPTNQSKDQKQKLLSVSKVIEIAKTKGYDFGKGDPKLRLRYLNSLGFIPYANRHQDKSGQKFTTGFYPKYLPQLLLKIQNYQKQGLNTNDILKKSQQFQEKHSNIDNLNTNDNNSFLKPGIHKIFTAIASIIFFLFASTLLVWANEETNAFPWLNKYIPLPIKQAIRSISTPAQVSPIPGLAIVKTPRSYQIDPSKLGSIDANTLQSHPASDFLLLSDYISSSNAFTFSGLPVTSFLRSNTNDYLEGDNTKLYLSSSADKTTYYLASDGGAHFKVLNTDYWANSDKVDNLNSDLLDGLSEDNFLRSGSNDYLQGSNVYLYLDQEADDKTYYLSSTGNAILNNLTTTTLTITNLSSSLTPSTNNIYSLGSSTYQFKDLYIDGTAYLDTADIDSLTVNTSLTATAFQLSTGAADGSVLTSNADGTATWQALSSGSSAWTLTGSSLYPSSTSYNVGIGTTGPGYKLDVAGTGRFTGNLNMGTGAKLVFPNETGDKITLGYTAKIGIGGGLGLLLTGGDDYVSVKPAISFKVIDASDVNKFQVNLSGDVQADGTLSIDGSGDSYITGNVGIGTTSLGDDNLRIYRNSASTGTRIGIYNPNEGVLSSSYLSLYQGTTNEIYGTLLAADESFLISWLANRVTLYTDEDAGGISLASLNNSGDIRFLIGSGTPTEMVRIDSSGNVGIGTTSPAAKLDVAGHIYPSADGVYDLGAPVGSATWRDIYISSGGAIGPSSNDAINFSGTSYININPYRGSTIQATKTDTTAITLVVKGQSSQTGDLLQWQNSSGTGLGAIDINGNVGIGTTGPEYLLHLTTSNDNVARFHSSDSIGQIIVSDSTDAAFFGTESNKAYFGLTSGLSSDNLVIDTSGNVGIGTVSPGKKLDVAGNAYIGSATEKLYIADGGSDIELIGYDGSGYNDIDIRAQGETQLFLKTDGNVGIGTTGPSWPLHVYKADAFSRIHVQQTGTGAYGAQLALQSDDSNFLISSYDDGYSTVGAYTGKNIIQAAGGNFVLSAYESGSDIELYAGQRTTPDVFIESGGNVGIGTTGPSYKLDVVGDIRTSSKLYGANSNAYIDVYNSGSGNTNIVNVQTGAMGHILFSPGNTEKVRFESSGNVGIGTTSPSQKLEVVGSIKSSVLDSDGTVYSNAGVLTNVNPSSLAYKYDVGGIDLDPKRIFDLSVKSFKWLRNDREDFGLIAEEVKETLPELYMEANGIKGYKLDHIPFYLLEIAKEHEMRLDDNGFLISDLFDTNLGMAVNNDLQDDSLLLLESRLDALEVLQKDNESTVSALLADIQSMDNKVVNLTDKISFLEEQIDLFTIESTGSSILGESTNYLAQLGNLLEASSSGLIASKDLTVLGDTLLNNLGITGSLNAGLIVIDGIEGSINSLGNTLYLQNLFGAGSLDIFNGAIVMTPEGDIKIVGTVEADRIQVKEFCIEDVCLTKEDLERLIRATMSAKTSQ